MWWRFSQNNKILVPWFFFALHVIKQFLACICGSIIVPCEIRNLPQASCIDPQDSAMSHLDFISTANSSKNFQLLSWLLVSVCNASWWTPYYETLKLPGKAASLKQRTNNTCVCFVCVTVSGFSAYLIKGPRTLQRFLQHFFQKNRCENRCPYIELLKKFL